MQPNPARDAVDVEGMPDGAILRATNAWGQSLPVNWTEAGYRLDVSPWPSGIYWLQWTHTDGSHGTPQKLVIAQ
jgi:hypothetical protein